MKTNASYTMAKNYKKIVREEIYRLKKEEIVSLESMYNVYNDSADIDENSKLEVDDFAHQSQSMTSASNLADRLSEQNDLLEEFMRLSEDPHHIIEEGSIVKTPSLIFYIGLPLIPFKLDDEEVVAISIDAPIYEAMKGKSKGEEFEFNGTNYLIEDVL